MDRVNVLKDDKSLWKAKRKADEKQAKTGNYSPLQQNKFMDTQNGMGSRTIF